MNIRFLAIALLCVLIPKACFSSEADLTDRTTNVSLNTGPHDTVMVSFSLVSPSEDYVYRSAFMWGGDETQSPRRIIGSLTVLKDKQKVFVPLSAYADLGDPRHISLKPSDGKGFLLTIIGGDAAGAYKALLEFKRGEITRRKVTSGEFPKEVWEETRFSFNHLDN